ncbi:MAG: sialidase family protein, partial [Acidobacteriota bacterium]
MKRISLTLLAVAAGLASGFALAHDTDSRTRPGVLGFDITAQGDEVSLLLTVQEGNAIALRHLLSEDGGATWSAEREVDLGGRPVHPPGPGSEPQIAAEGERLLVIWTTPGTSRWGSGPLVGAWSEDLGKTWSKASSPATTGSTDSHGEVDLLVDGDWLHAVWLDNRDGSRGLRTARSDDFGRSWQPEQTVDPTTCTCCWNRMVQGPDGHVYVIYRDAEPRDLALARVVDGRWQRLARPAGFDWQFDGCPSVGGALAWTSSGALHA